MVKIKNTTKGTMVAEQILVADTFFKRLQGLLGKAPLAAGHGLIIKPCSSVHTLGMRYSIDVMFIDVNHRIIKIAAEMSPGRIAMGLGSSYVVELAAGGAKKADCSVGDIIEW